MTSRSPRTLKLAPPPEGWATVWTIVELGGIHNRTLRSWIEEGLVERPNASGVNSFYSPRAVLQVKAIAALRAKGLRRQAFAAEVRGASDDELRAIIGPPPAVPPAEPPDAQAPVVAAVTEVTTTAVNLNGERWVHVPLIPGVQLLVRADATAFAMRTAEEICQKYGTR